MRVDGISGGEWIGTRSTGWTVTRELPTQALILVRLAGPSFSTRPTRCSVVERVETTTSARSRCR